MFVLLPFQNDHLLDDLGEALGSGGGLANIPLTLSRWTEESRVLDGDAAHDYITGMSSVFLMSYRLFAHRGFALVLLAL